MTLPNIHTAYTAEYTTLDRALASPNGIRLPFKTYDNAAHRRARLHYARKIDRKRSHDVYSPGDHGYGTSQYDPLVCRIKTVEGQIYLYIEPGETDANIEELPACEPSPQNSPSPSGTTPLEKSSESPSPATRRM